MTGPVWIAILTASFWGIINTVVAGMYVRKRTSAETVKIAEEAKSVGEQTEDRIYERLQTRLEKAEERADKAVEASNKQGDRVMALINMVERHISWDKVVRQMLIEKGVPEDSIPEVPTLDPYAVLNSHQKF